MTIREFECGSPNEGVIVNCNQCGQGAEPELLLRLEHLSPKTKKMARSTAERHQEQHPGHTVVIAFLHLLGRG